MNNARNKRDDLIYYEFCYKVVGILYEVYNQLGYGYDEKTYQKAVAKLLEKTEFKYLEQLYSPVVFEGGIIGKIFFDFLIENGQEKIVLELKRGDRFSKAHIDQVYKYLVNHKLELGILAYFGPRGIIYKRILNINPRD